MPQLLHDTLLQVMEGLRAPDDCGLVVTEATVDLPIEVTAMTYRGELVLIGSPPHSRWVAGVLPAVHLAHLRVELEDDAGGRG